MQHKLDHEEYLYSDFCAVPKEEMRRRISQVLMFIANHMKHALDEEETESINQAAIDIMEKEH